MLALILDILYLCMPENKTLGKVAMVLNLLGTIIDFFFVGLLCVIDLILFFVVLGVYNKH
jgi:hypothetical protein